MRRINLHDPYLEEPEVTRSIAPVFSDLKQKIVEADDSEDPISGNYSLVAEYVKSNKRDMIFIVARETQLYIKVKYTLPVHKRYKSIFKEPYSGSITSISIHPFTTDPSTLVDPGYISWKSEIARLDGLLTAGVEKERAEENLEKKNEIKNKNDVIKKILNFWLKTRGAMLHALRKDPVSFITSRRGTVGSASDPFQMPEQEPAPPFASPNSSISTKITSNTRRSKTVTNIFNRNTNVNNPRSRRSEHFERLQSQKKRREMRAIKGISSNTRKRRQEREERRREHRRTRRR